MIPDSVTGQMLVTYPWGDEGYVPVVVYLGKRPEGLALYRLVVRHLLDKEGMDKEAIGHQFEGGWDALFGWRLVKVVPFTFEEVHGKLVDQMPELEDVFNDALALFEGET